MGRKNADTARVPAHVITHVITYGGGAARCGNAPGEIKQKPYQAQARLRRDFLPRMRTRCVTREAHCVTRCFIAGVRDPARLLLDSTVDPHHRAAPLIRPARISLRRT
ncbi:hypothetical protein [Paraburkholderia fungorum]|uniref:hypothetical protein n=1 Tax=Paraburkholderia fungorum TaxID=134537 RepID=UPI0009433233|nr:hypothetical protein [Paraburkholderia fungorum]